MGNDNLPTWLQGVEPLPPPPPSKKRPGPFLYFFGTLAVCGLASLIVLGFYLNDNTTASSPSTPKPTQTPGRIIPRATEVPVLPSEIGATVACERYVSEQLKAPTSAEFSPAPVVGKMGPGQYIISGYVDAENSFGVVVRSDYRCTVKHESGINYRLINLDVAPR